MSDITKNELENKTLETIENDIARVLKLTSPQSTIDKLLIKVSNGENEELKTIPKKI